MARKMAGSVPPMKNAGSSISPNGRAQAEVMKITHKVALNFIQFIFR